MYQRTIKRKLWIKAANNLFAEFIIHWVELTALNTFSVPVHLCWECVNFCRVGSCHGVQVIAFSFFSSCHPKPSALTKNKLVTNSRGIMTWVKISSVQFICHLRGGKRHFWNILRDIYLANQTTLCGKSARYMGSSVLITKQTGWMNIITCVWHQNYDEVFYSTE